MGPFGARLKQEREKKGITLDEIALSTKIGTRMLRALEEERFEQLPGGIFNKGFVRAYARHLGLDEEQTIADYLKAAGLDTPPPPPVEIVEKTKAPAPPPPVEEKTTEPWNVPWGALAIVLLVTAFVFAVWGVYSREAKHDSHPAVQEASKTVESSNLPTDSSMVLSAQKEVGSIPAEKLQPAAMSTALEIPKPNQGTALSAPVITPLAKDAPIPGAVRVLIKAREDSWLSITADGRTIMENKLSASAEKFVQAHKELVIRAGNVGALDFWFNGTKLPAQGDVNQVKTLIFNAHGLQPTVVKAQSTTPQQEVIQP